MHTMSCHLLLARQQVGIRRLADRFGVLVLRRGRRERGNGQRAEHHRSARWEGRDAGKMIAEINRTTRGRLNSSDGAPYG